MKSLNTLLDQASSTSLTRPTKPTAANSQESQLAILDALRALKAMGLISFLPDSTDAKVWAAGLVDLKPSEIRMGVSKAKDFREFCTLPAFRELCHVKPEDFGMPDAYAAYVEACNKQGPHANWTHPAVYWAGAETGWFELRNRTEKEIFPLFRRNYEVICNRAIAGEPLDLPVQKAIADSHTPVFLTPEQNKRRCAALKELLA